LQESEQLKQVEGKLSAKRVRQAKIAQMAVAGKPYAEIAQDMGMRTVTPSQTVYSALGKQGAQAELSRIASESKYTVAKCLEELDAASVIATQKKIPVAMVQASMAKAKVSGLLVEQFVDLTDRSRLKDEALDTLGTLGITSEGIAPLSASSSDSEPMQAQVKDSHEQG
jgi:hypothetical protein